MEPTAQISLGERPPTPLTDAQIGVAGAGTSANGPPVERMVSVRPWQPEYDGELAAPTPQMSAGEKATSPPSVFALPGFGELTSDTEAAA